MDNRRNSERKMSGLSKEKYIINIILFLIVLLSFFLRIHKIDHHLHGGLFFEEPAYLKMILTGEVSHIKRFNYPPLFDLYLSFINGIYFLFNLVGGHFKKFADLINAFNVDYSIDFIRVLFIHRLLTAIIGTLTVSAVFLIARNLFNNKAGLISALFLAVAPLHIYTSTDAVGPDNLQLLFICLAFLYICKIFLFGNQKKYYIFAGLFIGLAAAIKYFGIFCIGPLLLAHFFSRKEKSDDKYLYLSIAIISGVFLVTCLPFMITSPRDVINTVQFFIKNYSQPVSSYNTIYQVLSQARGWISYPAALIYGVGPGMFILTILGLLFSLIRHSRKDLLILILPLTYYLFIGIFYNAIIKYFLPAIPFMILLAVNFLLFIYQKISSRGKIVLVFYTALLFVILPSFQETIYYKHWISQKPVDEEIKKWVLKNIPNGSSVLFDGDDLSGSDKLEPLLFYDQQLPYKVTIIDWRSNLEPDIFFNDNKFDYVIIDTTRAIPVKLKPLYKYIGDKFTLDREFKPLFPTPQRNFFSIYGTFYNHSFKVFKNNNIDR